MDRSVEFDVEYIKAIFEDSGEDKAIVAAQVES